MPCTLFSLLMLILFASISYYARSCGFEDYNKCVNEGNVPKSVQDENYAKARRAFLVGYDRSVPKLRQANHCTGCEQCNPHCPQGIDIPKEMQRIDKFVEELKVNG